MEKAGASRPFSLRRPAAPAGEGNLFGCSRIVTCGMVKLSHAR